MSVTETRKMVDARTVFGPDGKLLPGVQQKYGLNFGGHTHRGNEQYGECLASIGFSSTEIKEQYLQWASQKLKGRHFLLRHVFGKFLWLYMLVFSFMTAVLWYEVLPTYEKSKSWANIVFVYCLFCVSHFTLFWLTSLSNPGYVKTNNTKTGDVLSGKFNVDMNGEYDKVYDHAAFQMGQGRPCRVTGIIMPLRALGIDDQNCPYFLFSTNIHYNKELFNQLLIIH